MDITPILVIFGYIIYAGMAASALYGVFQVILVLKRITQKRFFSDAAAEQFLQDVRERLQNKDFDGVSEMCDSPQYWSKAVPQMILVALANRNLPVKKLRQTVAERFEREVLADLEFRTSWIATVVKAAPMLGLLGTVVGMINAFAKIAAMSATGTDPSVLANDISFALLTTSYGLMIAIPLVLAGNAISVRMGKMQDSVQHHMGIFIDDLQIALGREQS